MTSYLFIAGRIRALEDKLLSLAQLERMVHATTPKDAFRVLVELQYAQYIDEAVKPQDFQAILDKGLEETKNLITDDGSAMPELDLIWLRYDLANIKSALRLKREGREMAEYTAKEGFAFLGDLPQQEIINAVWHGEMSENIPSAVATALGSLHENMTFAEVETTMDRAYFAALKDLAHRFKTTFAKTYYQFQIDTANIRAWARCRYTFKRDFTAEDYVPGGAFALDLLQKTDDFSALKSLLGGTDYAIIVKEIREEAGEIEVLQGLEQGIEKAYQRFLSEAEDGEIDAVQIPMAYFEKRIHNARLIKLVMLGKFAGLSDDVIHQKVKHLHG